MTQRPPPTRGLGHLALWVPDEHFAATLRFYRDGMGMAIDWQPDDDNVYLSSGRDNLALHRTKAPRRVELETSSLDHLGFVMDDADTVDKWYAWLEPRAAELGIELLTQVKLHRDGATSFYLRDPAGHNVQLIHLGSGDRLDA